ncbi:MAG TPA: DUF2894 domain-containing protein [Ramlibacter sp.]|nr:DUF2894 domain-containing protein [Ramlibacter sp.]
MTQPGVIAASPAAARSPASTELVSLESLRSAGAQRFDPMRFHYLEALSQRMHAHSGEARRLLDARLQAALADYAQRFRQARAAASEQLARVPAQQPALARDMRRLLAAGDFRALQRLGRPSKRAAGSPLAELNRYIRARTQEGGDTGVGGDSDSSSEMKSARRFRQTWSTIAAQEQVARAVVRGPEKPGPLNSHMLVLRTLALMGELSPEYLQRFLSQVDTLLWLEQAERRPPPAPAKAARKTRKAK